MLVFALGNIIFHTKCWQTKSIWTVWLEAENGKWLLTVLEDFPILYPVYGIVSKLVVEQVFRHMHFLLVLTAELQLYIVWMVCSVSVHFLLWSVPNHPVQSAVFMADLLQILSNLPSWTHKSWFKHFILLCILLHYTWIWIAAYILKCY